MIPVGAHLHFCFENFSTRRNFNFGSLSRLICTSENSILLFVAWHSINKTWFNAAKEKSSLTKKLSCATMSWINDKNTKNQIFQSNRSHKNIFSSSLQLEASTFTWIIRIQNSGCSCAAAQWFIVSHSREV